jgi:hypothetical protein
VDSKVCVLIPLDIYNVNTIGYRLFFSTELHTS